LKEDPASGSLCQELQDPTACAFLRLALDRVEKVASDPALLIQRASFAFIVSEILSYVLCVFAMLQFSILQKSFDRRVPRMHDRAT
jgi:hypothetical protein